VAPSLSLRLVLMDLFFELTGQMVFWMAARASWFTERLALSSKTRELSKLDS